MTNLRQKRHILQLLSAWDLFRRSFMGARERGTFVCRFMVLAMVPMCSLVGCSMCTLEPAWPETVCCRGLGKIKRIVVPFEVLFDPNKTITRHYPSSALRPPSTSNRDITVYYIPEMNLFFLRPDFVRGDLPEGTIQKRWDGFIGPFEGDPRQLLAADPGPSGVIP